MGTLRSVTSEIRNTYRDMNVYVFCSSSYNKLVSVLKKQRRGHVVVALECELLQGCQMCPFPDILSGFKPLDRRNCPDDLKCLILRIFKILIKTMNKKIGSLEGESSQGFLRAQNPKLS